MWTRRTFHECAAELEMISTGFRAAYTNKFGFSETRRNQIMQSASERGVELLRILALSVRSEQDFGNVPKIDSTVGAIKYSVDENDIYWMTSLYRPPYYEKEGFEPLALREALNKIAHADPSNAGFYANDITHDLILHGMRRNEKWIAIVSLVDLCRVIKTIPDKNIQS
jgi:hypothetical protein